MNPNHVLQLVADEYMISVDDILSVHRHHPFPQARQVVIYLLSSEFRCTQIGRILNKDHSTVIVSNKKMIDYLEFDEQLKERVDRLKKQLKLPYDTIMKVSYEQLKALKGLLEYFLEGYKPKDLMEKMFKNSMNSLYEKVRKKVITRKKNLTLNENEQIAFAHFQRHLHSLPGIDGFGYAENVCRIIIQQIYIDYG